jgi:hypothetical protein
MQSDDDKETKTCAAEEEIRAALSQHWAASDANNFATDVGRQDFLYAALLSQET